MTNLNKISCIVWICLLGGVIVGSLLPLGQVPSEAFFLGDKLLHFGTYAIVGITGLLAASNRRAMCRLLMISFGISVLIEILQPLSGRSFELLDIAANGMGVISAVPIAVYVIFPLCEIKPLK